MNINEIILDIRKKHNITQGELAQKLFVTRQAVSRWENGKTVPNIDTLHLISQIFDISMDLLTDKEIHKDDTNAEINSKRFQGFADIYDSNRPTVPTRCIDIITNYFGGKPKTVIDLGCGTGLSTQMWQGKCKQIIGIDPSENMLNIAKSKKLTNIEYIQAYSHNTGLPNECADVVVCSQSFHWMNPQDTLKEVNRILRPNGIFATIDCDWPPVFNWQVELAYFTLFNKVRTIENENKAISHTFNRWEKSKHLDNIKQSGYFRFVREIVLENFYKYNSDRFIGLALSQGSLQTILKKQPKLIENDILHFEKSVNKFWGNGIRTISFCYRMRIAIK